MNLAQWQNYCDRYFCDENIELPEKHKRLSIYKDSIESIHIKAMEISFPVIRKLLGRTSFIRLVREYLTELHWQTNSLDELGHDFDQFIESHKLSNSLNYLSEVASLEWLIQSLAEKQMLAVDLVHQLQQSLDTDNEFKIGVRDHIGVFYSSKGAVKIWIAHQQQEIDKIDLNGIKPSFWIIENDLSEVKFKPLDKQTYNFIDSLAAQPLMRQA